MNSRSNEPVLISELDSLKEVVPFGIKNKNKFIELKHISIDISGKLFYKNNNNEFRSVSSFIRHEKGLKTARWLNHLYFIDGYGKERAFKKFVSQKHKLKFT